MMESRQEPALRALLMAILHQQQLVQTLLSSLLQDLQAQQPLAAGAQVVQLGKIMRHQIEGGNSQAHGSGEAVSQGRIAARTELSCSIHVPFAMLVGVTHYMQNLCLWQLQ